MISASFLSIKDNLKENISKLTKSDIDYLHLDIMDGKFVKNSTYTIDEIKNIINYDKKLDIHLMVSDVKKYIDDFKCLNPYFITFHYEASCDIMSLINYIKSLNIKVGIAINPNTDVSVIDAYLPYIDLVLIMSVAPGEGGQKFIESSINKIKYLKDERIKNNYNYLISVDGGINDETIKKVKSDIAVSGSYITNGDIFENVKKLKESIYE
jgi:ribulose-phosphate 3-epimerase